jgi:hypothetical protein
MGAQRTSFAKLQRDRAKKANAAAKRERRQAKQDRADESPGTTPAPPDQGGELSAGELLEQIEHVHRLFEAKQIDQDEYDERKAELLARLPID